MIIIRITRKSAGKSVNIWHNEVTALAVVIDNNTADDRRTVDLSVV